MMLPKISGTEVLKALTGNPATMNIPVIVLTSLRQRNEGKLLDASAVPTSKTLFGSRQEFRSARRYY
jgi:CheY-like chemotaxis protein